MIILLESASPQTFKFIPRSYTATSMSFRHEETNIVLTYNITPAISSYYLSITATPVLKQDHFYELTIYNGADVIFQDRVLCTNQTLSSFSVNNGEYVTKTTNNDYVIYE
jgi:hypothetical protein